MDRYPSLDSELEKSAPQLWALRPLFTDPELRKIEAARRRIDGAYRTIVYAVYENHHARSGGIFAVADSLPRALGKVSAQAVVLSPFHRRLKKALHPPGVIVGEVDVPFQGRFEKTTIYRYENQGVTWYLFGADTFFDAPGGLTGDDPYDHSSAENPEVSSNPLLLRDGLFAAAAIPRVLRKLGMTRNVIVHVQDWQLAATALTVKEAIVDDVLDSAAVVLTSHNPYDCGLTLADLAKITPRVNGDQWPRPEPDTAEMQLADPAVADTWSAPADRGAPVVGDPTRTVDDILEDAELPGRRRATVYECMIPLFDAPVSTVSRQFARDLTTNPLQTMHFANHLQQVFRLRGLVGVDNGLFMKPHCAFTPDAVESVSRGDFEPILSEKRAKRMKMLEVLTQYRPPARIGGLLAAGDEDLTQLPAQVPVFMMFGRMDPGQKGFDVLAQAVRSLPPATAKFIVCPIVPARAEAFLDLWRTVAVERAGDVVIFPFRMQQGYLESMAGATYCVMPSLHEPFGAATEPYLQGTPVVAHATGGLVQQVIDARQYPAEATGILYRPQEVGTAEQQGRQWRAVLDSPDPASRMHFPLYVSLVQGLAAALTEAIRIFQNDTQLYGQMLSHLYPQATKFDWDRAAAEYGKIYAAAVRAG
jgi:glycogen synthase